MEPRLLLRSVKIENVRALRGVHFHELVSPRDRPVFKAVIAGMNGSGKTTFLEALLLGLRRCDLVIQAGNPLSRCFIPDGGRVQVDIDVQSAPGTVLEARCPCVLRLQCEGNGANADKRTSLLLSGGCEELGFDQVDEVLSLLRVRYFSSKRTFSCRGGVVDATLLGDIDNPRERDRLATMRWRLATDPKSDKTQAWLARINEVWKFWTYDGSAIRVLDTPRGSDLFISSDGLDIPLADAGSGDLDWLTMFGSLITEEFSGLLLIDNPEMHMDASNQGRLLRCLEKTFPGSQFIVATQSNEAWEYAHSYERYLPY